MAMFTSTFTNLSINTCEKIGVSKSLSYFRSVFKYDRGEISKGHVVEDGL